MKIKYKINENENKINKKYTNFYLSTQFNVNRK